MPFKVRSLVSEREEMCRLALAPGANKRELFRRFDVSPTAGYKWLDRYKAEGVAGLQDRSRRPKTSPQATPPEVAEQVVKVRRDQPKWGGRKINKVMLNEGQAGAPAASTITDILRREGLLDGPGAGETTVWRRFEHPEPNDLWQMDFKGHFATDQGRCHPLTVLDDHSRYALAVEACGNEQGRTVEACLERIFERYGLPRRILCDNGPPWGAANSPEVHTKTTLWLMDREIGVVHGRPRHPQTQGKDERFHRTLKGEAIDGKRFRDLKEAQAGFDRFRETYNTRRPHEGIGMQAPASRYRMSLRRLPERIDPPDYEPQALVRKVQKGGWLHIKGGELRLSKALEGRALALRPTTTDGIYDLCYRSFRLTQVDLRQAKPCVHHVPAQASTLSPV